MNPPLPLEIIGGGLAGLSLGLALRHAGVPVTVHEAGSYPRHRVCGEFITGLPPATIARLGLAPFLADALAHHSLTWFFDGQAARRQHLPAPALALSRHTLDARLADAFVAAGGQLRLHTRVSDLTDHPGRIVTTGRRRLARSPWLGLKIHVADLPLSDDLELHLGADAYVGVTRVAENRVNICGLFRQRPLAAPGAQLLLAYLSETGLGSLATRIARATILPDSFSAVAALNFDPPATAPDSVTLGDAWTMIPPFTGHGMAMAFQSADCALDPLLAYATQQCDWATTRAAIQTALARRFRMRLRTAALLHPFLLRPRRQRWLTRLARFRLLPLSPLYAALH